MADNTFLAPLSPIQRSSPSQRLLKFRQNEFSIYNKFGPYEQAGGGRGPNQPFIYTRLTDSNSKKNFTARDTQALPVGSTIRDTERMIKFLRSGAGISFLATQAFLQSDASFDETRTYNIGSPIAATTIPILGVRPIRHIESNSGILNFFVTSLLSTIGISGANANRTSPIPGTATGTLPTYVQAKRDGRYGVMRANTAASGTANINKIWVGSAGTPRPVERSGFLQSVARTLFSTSGLFSGAGRAADYQYRPEYKSSEDNAYRYMRSDSNGILSFSGRRSLYYGKVGGLIVSTGKFYNDAPNPLSTREIAETIRENEINAQFNAAAIEDFDGTIEQRPVVPTPENLNATIIASEVAKNSARRDSSYAEIPQMQDRLIDDTRETGTGLLGIYNKMITAFYSQEATHPMYQKSLERYRENPNKGIYTRNAYPVNPTGPTSIGYSAGFNTSRPDSITLDKRMFAQSGKMKLDDIGRRDFQKGKADEYNKLGILNKQDFDRELTLLGSQSKDIIFFYFYDLVNEKYIPFRATLNGLSEQNSPDWDELKYIGRADRLFVYKGFTRDVSFTFRVYANSIEELIPMWERINYLTGLGRPSKYTGAEVSTNTVNPLDSTETAARSSSGVDALSGFIYPPMIEFRIGDLYVDQPGVIRSNSVTIPDDATWETLRSVRRSIPELPTIGRRGRIEEEYTYVYQQDGLDLPVTVNARSRQLPNMVDITMQISLLEKEVAITNGRHFGPKGSPWLSLA